MATTKKVTRAYTTTSGERVTKYNDGTEKRVPSSGGSTSNKKVSFGVNASGAPLQGVPPKLETDKGQTLKDYSIAWGGGSFGKGVTSDSTDARNGETQLGTDIGDKLKQLQKDQERQIKKERDALERRKEEELLNINQDADKQKSDTELKQAGETGTTSMALARMGGYLGNTASQQGVLQNLANVQRTELSTLENSRQDALRAANQAYEDRDFELARENLQVARDTEQEIYNRQQEFDKINREELKKVEEVNKKAATQASIFTAIDGGAKDVKSIFNALGGTTTIEEINSVLNAIKPAAGDGFAFSTSNTAALLGAGLSKDDIQAFNDYVNESGYTEELRANLTPAQRVVADKIFREVEKIDNATGTSGTTDKPLTALDVQRFESVYGVVFPPGIPTSEANAFIRNNMGEPIEDMQEAINAIYGPQDEGDGGGVGDAQIEVTEDWFRNNLTQAQLKKLADLVGASAWWRYKSYDIDDMFNTPEFFTLLGDKIQQLRDEGINDTDIIIALTT